MKKRDVIFIGIIVCNVIFSVYQYKQIKKLNSNICKTSSNYKYESVKKDSYIEKKYIKLKEGFKIEIFSDCDNFSNISQRGSLGELNSYGINNFNNLTVLGQENQFFTRVSIEGVIPTWTIKTEIDEEIKYIDNHVMYILKPCDVLLTPTDDSISVFRGERGNAITIKGEYSDWYYIVLNRNHDPDTLNYGWIKKSCLGYYNEFNTNIKLDVNLKKDSPIKITGIDEIQVVKNHWTWGTIYGETDKEYILLLPGASEAVIDKKYVEPFSVQKK